MALNRLIYLSVAAEGLQDSDIEDILDSSTRNNTRANITGLLVFTGKHFIQTVEGAPEKLAHLVAKISKDSRHHDLEVLTEGTIDRRLFSNWAMGLSKTSDERLSYLLSLRGGLNQDELSKKLEENSTFTSNFLRGLIATK